jgi:hypothetical protein
LENSTAYSQAVDLRQRFEEQAVAHPEEDERADDVAEAKQGYLAAARQKDYPECYPEEKKEDDLLDHVQVVPAENRQSTINTNTTVV